MFFTIPFYSSKVFNGEMFQKTRHETVSIAVKYRYRKSNIFKQYFLVRILQSR